MWLLKTNDIINGRKRTTSPRFLVIFIVSGVTLKQTQLFLLHTWKHRSLSLRQWLRGRLLDISCGFHSASGYSAPALANVIAKRLVTCSRKSRKCTPPRSRTLKGERDVENCSCCRHEPLHLVKLSVVIPRKAILQCDQPTDGPERAESISIALGLVCQLTSLVLHRRCRRCC